MLGTPIRHGFPTFAAYTALGYLALILHHWVFGPDIAEAVTAPRIALVMANLFAGGWCFLRAIRMLLPQRQ